MRHQHMRPISSACGERGNQFVICIARTRLRDERGSDATHGRFLRAKRRRVLMLAAFITRVRILKARPCGVSTKALSGSCNPHPLQQQSFGRALNQPAPRDPAICDDEYSPAHVLHARLSPAVGQCLPGQVRPHLGHSISSSEHSDSYKRTRPCCGGHEQPNLQVGG